MSEAINCLFCKIVRGEIPSVKVREDARTFSFMDVQPASPGHILTVPKLHAANLLEIIEDDLCAVVLASQQIARAVQAALKPDGMRMVQTNGAAAGQTVFHYHVHIIPMYQGQRLVTHGRDRTSPEDLEAVAVRIRAALAD